MKKKSVILICLLSLLFIVNTLFVVTGMSTSFDNGIYSFIRSFECSFLDNYFIFVTKFGNPVVVIFIILLFLLMFRNKYGIMVSIMAIVSSSTNTFFKYILKRERPAVLKLISQGGYSYPSGHAMISVAVYGYFLYLVMKYVKNKWIKYILSCLLVLFILSIGISRIYLGVHYASDIVGGFVLSLIELIILINVSKKYFRGN